jgi:hypothetical protein
MSLNNLQQLLASFRQGRFVAVAHRYYQQLFGTRICEGNHRDRSALFTQLKKKKCSIKEVQIIF